MHLTPEQIAALTAAFGEAFTQALVSLAAAGDSSSAMASISVVVAAAEQRRGAGDVDQALIDGLEVLADVHETLQASAVVPPASPDRPALAAIASRRPASHAPTAPTRQLGAVTMRMSTPAGLELADLRAAAEAFDRVDRDSRDSSRRHGSSSRARVLTLRTSYPEERQLGESQAVNDARVDAVTAPPSLVAAGGLCAPVETVYEILGGISTGERPLRDALPSFEATRGGVQLRRPLGVAAVAGAVGVWTMQNDLDAGLAGAPDPTKPVLVADCQPQVSVDVKAVTERTQWGNAMLRFDPEMVASILETVLAQGARRAEQELLADIQAAGTAVTAPKVLGAARDLIVAADLAAAGYRSRHRMRSAAVLRVTLPEWVRGLIRSDMARQSPGDRATAVTDAQIDELFMVRGVRPVWVLDAQVFGAQGAGVLLEFPDTVTMTLWAEGSFLYLDGGRLDVGIVRSPDLNEVNSAEIFTEQFEGVAFRGIESLTVTCTVDPTGLAAGTIDTTAISD